MDTLDLIGNKKVKLAFWIVEHLDSENKFIGTYRSIQQKTGMSLETIQDTMNALLECNFLHRIQNGVYIVNPDIVFKGGRGGRMNVLIQYQDTKSSVVPFKSN